MRPLIVLILSALLLGCGSEEFNDLRDFVANSGVGLRGKIEPPPEVKPYEYFAYANDADLPNPFEPREEEMKVGGANQPQLDRPKEALEEYPLDSLKMVGYLFQKGIGYAVIRATDGKLHRVKPGNYMGMNFGLIQQVNETEIFVKEMVQDSTGVWSERVSSLQMQLLE